MNSISNNNNVLNNELTQYNRDPANILSEDLFAHILSYLSPKSDLSPIEGLYSFSHEEYQKNALNFSLVNKTWNQLINSVLKISQESFIKQIKILNTYCIERLTALNQPKFSDVLKALESWESNLPNVVNTTSQTKKIMSILHVADVSSQIVRDLEDLHLSKLNHKFSGSIIPDSVKGILQGASKIKKTEDTKTADSLFSGMIRSLVEIGKIDFAIKLTDKMSSDDSKSNALAYISNLLLAKNDMEKSYEVAMKIPSLDSKSKALLEISGTLLIKNRINKALPVALLIPNESIQSQALKDISKALLIKDLVNNAYVVAMIIPTESVKSEVLREISEKLITSTPFENNFTIKIAMEIPCENIRSQAFEYICMLLIIRNSFDEALAVANIIPDHEKRSGVILKLEEIENSKKTNPQVI